VKTLQYQVLVVNQGGFSFASVPDLECEAVGASPSQAIMAVREQALRRLDGYRGSAVAPPGPSRLTLAQIALPAPRSPHPGGVSAVGAD
jgi:hypothetical protein